MGDGAGVRGKMVVKDGRVRCRSTLPTFCHLSLGTRVESFSIAGVSISMPMGLGTCTEPERTKFIYENGWGMKEGEDDLWWYHHISLR